MLTNTKELINTAKLRHPKLHKSLEMFMYIVGTKGEFHFSEDLEKQITRMRIQLTDDDSCATDFATIYIGLFFPYFTDNLDENFNIAKGIVGHEVGHIRFTSKKAWDMYLNTCRGKYKKLAAYARDILNIVEDDRIEHWMAKVSKYLNDAFYLLCQRMAENIQQDFDEIDYNEKLSANKKLVIIRNAILYIRCTQSTSLPTIKNEEIMNYLKQIFPYMVYCRTSKSTKEAVKVAHKIMDIISPLCKEFNNSEESKMDGMYPDNSKGSANPTENDGLNNIQSKEKTAPNNENENSELSEELTKLKDELAEAVAKEFDSKNGKDSSGKSGDLSKEFTSDLVEDITENLMKKSSQMKTHTERKIKELKSEARKPVTATILGEFMNSTKKSNKQKVAETLEEKKITELKPVLVNEDIHKECVPVFRERTEMIPFTDFEYLTYIEQYSMLIKRGANELLKLSEQKRQIMQRMQTSGRLDSRRLIKAAAFNAKDVYYKKRFENDKVDMDVLIFVDRSGSNIHQVLNKKNDTYLPRYEVNRIAAIVQHEMLKQAKITHAVWSFEEKGVNNIFAPMIHFNNCFERDAGLYLKDIDASSMNRDGYSIAYAGDYLLKHGVNRKKLLIVISDGQPHGNRGYDGSLAVTDVKNTVIDLKRKGVKTIGIFTGKEEENQLFEHMYDNHMFLNNDNIHNLPEELRKKLTLEFKEYLSSF